MAYDHRLIEPRWQTYWRENRTFESVRRPGHSKYYVLDMFPYPSGDGLHVGHIEGYSATDIVARYKRMCGYDVLHPMGWDAFGLPAEQHAIRTGTHPRVTTAANVATFKRQLERVGLGYDWDREVNTTDPGYVRFTQWIFLKLFERGLAFQSEVPVNWCPALGTVLANEEVQDGKSEVGGHPVVRQPLRQWQLRITAYADRLAADLEGLDWPETKQKQREWIGRSEGALVRFPIQGGDRKLEVYTTRPDTLFGATYMVIAPDHPLTLEIASVEQRPAVTAYVEAARGKSDLERTSNVKTKTGVATGAFAVNPLNGQSIPIFTADYVLGSYGTGAIMAVPAHDSRDFEFARQFGLPIVEVVSPDGTLHDGLEAAYTEPGIAVRSGEFDGLSTEEFKRRITLHLEQRGIGERKVNYKLRDWVFSRQRYWGEPIPIYFPVETEGNPQKGDPFVVDYGSPMALEESELPLELPELEDFRPGNDPQGPLARVLEWRFFQKGGKWFARETNTMPQWAGSCWYYLRYLDPRNETAICTPEAYADWMPVDLYLGGPEHAVLHLLYARFWHKVLFDLGVVTHAEPFSKLTHQGMILGRTYRYFAVPSSGTGAEHPVGVDEVKAGADGFVLAATGERVEPRFEVKNVLHQGNEVRHAVHGVLLDAVNEKMSKSRGNVVNPDEVIAEFGADSLRVYEMFMGPLERTKPWQTQGIVGVRNFLDRVHAIGTGRLSEAAADGETQKLMHRTIKKVAGDIEALRLNTAVSQMMIFSNHLNAQSERPRDAVKALLLCLAPFAPHLSEELWQAIGEPPPIARAAFPAWDEALCSDDMVEVPVQVNGKVRGRVVLALTADEAAARVAALEDPDVKRFLGDRAPAKVVYVPGRVLNVILPK
jgi:leucyl-tRNA synthetase